MLRMILVIMLLSTRFLSASISGKQLENVENRIGTLIDILQEESLESEDILLGEDEYEENFVKELENTNAEIEKSIRYTEALEVELPHFDFGYAKVFYKQPVRVGGQGMMFAPVLIPYLGTTETVGKYNWYVGVNYSTSEQYVVSPGNLKLNQLFVDVNDRNFEGFGDVKWIAAIAGITERMEINFVFGVTNHLDIGVRAPLVSTPEYVIYNTQLFQDYVTKTSQSLAMGDVEAWAKLRLFSTPGNHVRGAIRGDWRFPTGSQEELNSLGINQFSLSYIVTLEPTYGVTANFTSGTTVLVGDTEIFKRPVRLTPVAYLGANLIKRVNDNLALSMQLDSFTNPWKDIETEIFETDVSIGTVGVKYGSRFFLTEASISRGLTKASPETIFQVNLFSNKQLE